MSDIEWIEWAGGECPVDYGVIVDCKFRAPPFDNEEVPTPCYGTNLAWYHDGERDDIVAYRVLA